MKSLKSQLGFSLIEMIVSLAVFSAVVTISVGALLVLVATNDQLQGEQSIMTNLSFALDSMTREIRTGTGYYCRSHQNYAHMGPQNIFANGQDQDDNGVIGINVRDCDGRSNDSWDLHGISFVESGNSISGAASSRVQYFHDASVGELYRRIGAGDRESILSDDIWVHDFDVWVTGSEPLSPPPNDEETQPVVTITIAVSEDASTPSEDWYRLQTSVTQRVLDL